MFFKNPFKNFTKQLSSYYLTLFLAIIVGVLAGYGAIFFRWLIQILEKFFWGISQPKGLLETIQTAPSLMVIVIPTLGGLIVGLIIYFSGKDIKGHGVPEVIKSLIKYQGKIRTRVAIIKPIATAINISSGGSVGREGPIVQIGASFGSILARLLKLPPELIKTLALAGAAGGISATFNAPLGGVFFSLEILKKRISSFSFTIIVVASIFANLVSHIYIGNHPAFIFPIKFQLVSVFEILLFFILGIIAGIISVTFNIMIHKSEYLFNLVKIPSYIKTALGGLLIGFVGLFLPQVLSVGYATINSSLAGQFGIGFLLLLFLFKMLVTSTTLGSGGSGGVFTPSLFMGAMMGGIFGLVANNIFPNLTGDFRSYSLIGMGAVIAGTTHAPITAILILQEMTKQYAVIIPLTISCITSMLVSSLILKDSIYTYKLTREGIKFRTDAIEERLSTAKVKDIMLCRFEYAFATDYLNGVILFMQKTGIHNLPIISKRTKKYLGVIFFSDIKKIIKKNKNYKGLLIKGHYHKDLPLCYKEETLDITLKKFRRKNYEILPVVDKDKKLIAIIKQNDLRNIYNEIYCQLHPNI